MHDVLLRPDLVKAVGTHYVIQKNCCNGQVIWYSRDMANPSFCPVVYALNLVRRAVILGKSPFDPICVYQDTTDYTVYLTGAAITQLHPVLSVQPVQIFLVFLTPRLENIYCILRPSTFFLFRFLPFLFFSILFFFFFFFSFLFFLFLTSCLYWPHLLELSHSSAPLYLLLVQYPFNKRYRTAKLYN